MMNWLLVSCGLLILGIEVTLGKHHHEEDPPANEKADPNGHSKEVVQEEEANVEPVNQRAKRFAPYGWPIYPHYNPYTPHPYYAPQVLKKPALVNLPALQSLRTTSVLRAPSLEEARLGQPRLGQARSRDHAERTLVLTRQPAAFSQAT